MDYVECDKCGETDVEDEGGPWIGASCTNPECTGTLREMK